MFKVAVIGLGPAGAAALRRLSELGVEAIGIERKHALESPTVCGEFLPEPEAIQFISHKPSVRTAFNYISLARKLNTFDEIHLNIEGVRLFRMAVPGFTVSRRELVEKLVERANYVLGDDVVCIRRLQDHYVIKTRRGKVFESEYVIAADGYPSLTRRLLGCASELEANDLAIGVNMKMRTPNMNRRVVYMHASPQTPGGYAWIIPYEGEVSNVGIGIRYSYVKAGTNPIHLLKRFVELNPEGFLDSASSIETPRSRWIPVSGFYAPPVCGKVLFAGDSLGATNPINGGGIFTSMALGILAAEAVWLEKPEVYAERAWSEVGSILRIGRRYRKMVDFVFDHWQFSRLLKLAPAGLVTKVIKGEKTALYHFLGS